MKSPFSPLNFFFAGSLFSSATTSTATSISFQGDEVAIFTLKLLLRWLVVLLLITANVAAILFVIIVVIVIFVLIIFIVGILFVLAFNTGSGCCFLVLLFLIRRFLLIFCFGFYGHRVFTSLWIVAVLFVIITVIILLLLLLFLVIFNNSIYRRGRCFLRNF